MQVDDVKMARFRLLAQVTLVVTLLVILWGAYVRASGSGAGCGSHWPTCNGEVIEKAFKVPASGGIGLEADRGQMEYRRIRLSKR